MTKEILRNTEERERAILSSMDKTTMSNTADHLRGRIDKNLSCANDVHDMTSMLHMIIIKI
jgi:hypothetical protein